MKKFLAAAAFVVLGGTGAQAQTKPDIQCLDTQVKVVSALALAQGGNGIVGCKESTPVNQETYTSRPAERYMANQAGYTILADASQNMEKTPTLPRELFLDKKEKLTATFDAGTTHSDVRGNGTNFGITLGNRDVASGLKLKRTATQDDATLTGAVNIGDLIGVLTHARTTQNATNTFSEAPSALKLNAEQTSGTIYYNIPDSPAKIQPYATFVHGKVDSANFSSFNTTTKSTRTEDDTTSTRTYEDTKTTPMQNGVQGGSYNIAQVGIAGNITPDLRGTLGVGQVNNINGTQAIIDAGLALKHKYGETAFDIGGNENNNRLRLQHSIPLSNSAMLSIFAQNRTMTILRENISGIVSGEKKHDNSIGVNFTYTWGGTKETPRNLGGAFAKAQYEQTRRINDTDGVFAENTRTRVEQTGVSTTTSTLMSEVLKDQPGTASITGPATSMSGPITFNLAGSDADGIANWSVTYTRYRADGTIANKLDGTPDKDTLVINGIGNPTPTITTNISGGVGQKYVYKLSLTDNDGHITTTEHEVIRN